MTTPDVDERTEEFSLQPYLDMLRSHRRTTGLIALGVAIVYIVVALGALFRAPSEHFSSLQFRLLFTGAERGLYPNDIPFSPMEIVGAPVVTEVFRNNDLQRFGEYKDWKDALFVQRSSPALDLLTYEYQSRLADARLTPVDRARIEEEFKSRREAMSDPSFTLTLRRSLRFAALPSDLSQKVLTDTLRLWAEQAELRRGVLKYPAPVLSSRVVTRESLESLDYLVAVDRLRSEVARTIRSIDDLSKLPGATTIRSAKEDVTLPEIRARLDDVMRFELEPLMSTIRAEGLTKDPRLLSVYASRLAFQLQLDKAEAEARARAVRAALSEYVNQTSPGTGPEQPGARADSGNGAPVVPQLSESFLDRLQSMSALSQKGEMEYRRRLTDEAIAETRVAATFDRERAYYDDLAKGLAGMRAVSGSSAAAAQVKARTLAALQSVEKATSQLTVIYQELSAHNLNPSARLYAITGPFSQTTRRSLPLDKLLIGFVFVMVVTLVLVPAGLLLLEVSRRRSRAVNAATQK
jgi:hypothetical protein